MVAKGLVVLIWGMGFCVGSGESLIVKSKTLEHYLQVSNFHFITYCLDTKVPFRNLCTIELSRV